MRFYFRLAVCVVSLPLLACAEGWVRGSVFLISSKGEVQVSELGKNLQPVAEASLPLAQGGLLNFEVGDSSELFFSTSNKMFVQFQGSGNASIERFEQMLSRQDGSLHNSEEHSRIIFNFRKGSLAIDARNMGPASQCIVETPLGRVTIKNSLLMMDIEFDPRSGIYAFAVVSGDGRIRFTDNGGERYTIRSGQRLSGAGNSMTPSIEVGEMTSELSEHLDLFLMVIEEQMAQVDSIEVYESEFEPLNRVIEDVALTDTVDAPTLDRRPIVIERASDPNPVTPFRGEIPPPSAYRADIF